MTLDGWKEGRTDKASYRVVCPQLKIREDSRSQSVWLRGQTECAVGLRNNLELPLKYIVKKTKKKNLKSNEHKYKFFFTSAGITPSFLRSYQIMTGRVWGGPPLLPVCQPVEIGWLNLKALAGTQVLSTLVAPASPSPNLISFMRKTVCGNGVKDGSNHMKWWAWWNEMTKWFVLFFFWLGWGEGHVHTNFWFFFVWIRQQVRSIG